MEQVVARIDKKGNEITNTISHRLQFIDSARFMASLYQILLIILLKEFITLIVNSNMVKKNVKLVELNIKIATAFLNMQTLKMI